MTEIRVQSSTQKINVLGRTQKIVVAPNKTTSIIDGGVITIVNAGPVGPRGIRGPSGAERANGDIATPLLVWLMPHGLNIPQDSFNPAIWWFTDQSGNPMEPEDVVWVDADNALAVWGDVPVLGHWVVN